MKDMKKILITIAATAALTSLCWYIPTRLYRGAQELWLISSVKVPVSKALAEIDTDLQRGDTATATTKLQILQTEWERFDIEGKILGPGVGDIMVKFSHIPAPKENQ